ncbi:MAG: cytochrome ubiquinol oxidase subunit I, partial [Sciscionella sp.]
AEGMPRRYADYLASDGFTTMNTVSTIGSYILGASVLPFVYNVFKSYRYGEVVEVDDPWGFGMSLEWATSCPPPRHNFTSMPRIRSERPAFDLHYPHIAEQGKHDKFLSMTGRSIPHEDGDGAHPEKVGAAPGRDGGQSEDPPSR